VAVVVMKENLSLEMVEVVIEMELQELEVLVVLLVLLATQMALKVHQGLTQLQDRVVAVLMAVVVVHLQVEILLALVLVLEVHLLLEQVQELQ
jgi:hypothetical protein